MKPVSEQLDLLMRGVAQVISREELQRKLEKGQPLRIKLGADPSAPDLHLGHAVVLSKLRQFQEFGHIVQFLIGDFTAMIGDPTGRNAARPPLSPEQVATNARTYQDQVFRMLLPERTEVVFNSAWSQPLNFSDVIRLASRYTVARILERDDFEKRYRGGQPIGVHELLYPLIQGNDSVVLKSDIELCGTDQIFNCLVGRALQEDAGQEPEVILAMPLLEGLDGVQKMSKSLGNYIGITEPASEIFGKTMSISDDLMWKWYVLLLGKSEKELADLKQVHPMEAKKTLAESLAARFQGSEAARKAREDFEKKFSKHDAASADLPELKIGGKPSWSALDLVMTTGTLSSRGEARRLIQQGGVELGAEKLRDPQAMVIPPAGVILKVGKKHFFRLAN